MPCTCAQPCTHKRALSAPLRLRLYTQMTLTRERLVGRSERSMAVQLPFAAWFASFARSAPPPSDAVFGHGLFARAWVRRYVIHGEGASSASPPARLVTASAQGKQCRGTARAQRICSKRALEVAARWVAACLRCGGTVSVGADDLFGRSRIGSTCCRDVRRGSG
eukprot:6177317-Pleurochrysis_carterae.AAC.1